jgi:uncharacterized protein (DUF2062 family)
MEGGMVKRIGRWIGRRVPAMPTREDMARNRWLAPVAHRVLDPGLWRFTRRSVPRGVALGLFAGFIVPFGQVVVAAFMALPARANVPIAAVVTLVTNPFTLPFWLMVAHKVGTLALGVETLAALAALAEPQGGLLAQFGWLIEAAGVTAVGFVLLAFLTAAAGYLLSGWFWRWRVARKRKRRLDRARAATHGAATHG